MFSKQTEATWSDGGKGIHVGSYLWKENDDDADDDPFGKNSDLDIAINDGNERHGMSWSMIDDRSIKASEANDSSVIIRPDGNPEEASSSSTGTGGRLPMMMITTADSSADMVSGRRRSLN